MLVYVQNASFDTNTNHNHAIVFVFKLLMDFHRIIKHILDCVFVSLTSSGALHSCNMNNDARNR